MKKRLVTSIFIVAIVVPLLLIGGIPYKIFIMLLACLGLWEFMKARGKYPFIIQVIAYLFIALLVLYNINDTSFHLDETIVLSSFMAFLIPSILYQSTGKYTINDGFYLLGGVLFLGTAFSLLVLIRNIDLYLLLYLFLIAVATDVFAYLTGKYLGKHKLAPKISPKKTWEGSIGGSLFGVIIGTVFYLLLVNPSENIYYIQMMTLVLSIIGQIGDLVFSAIKRQYSIKDYSNLMPGHGGILDRFDSLKTSNQFIRICQAEFFRSLSCHMCDIFHPDRRIFQYLRVFCYQLPGHAGHVF